MVRASFENTVVSKGHKSILHNNGQGRSGQVRSGQLARPDGNPVLGRKQLNTKKHYLPVMKATNAASKRCQVSVDVSFQSPSCFQRKKAHTFSSQAKGGRPHRLLLGGVQSKKRRNHLCGGNVLMYAANFQYVTTADHAKMQTDVPQCPCVRATSAESHAKAPTNQFPQAEGSCDATFFAFQCRTSARPLGIVLGDRLQNRRPE